MRPVHKVCWLHRLVFLWLITWIITVPLFHIHIPDSTDNWSSIQSGGAHTIFTPDLPGEFARRHYESLGGLSSHLSQRVVNSPEMGIALFDEKSEQGKPKNLQGIPYRFAEIPLFTSVAVTYSWKYWKPHIDFAPIAARAPPRTRAYTATPCYVCFPTPRRTNPVRVLLPKTPPKSTRDGRTPFITADSRFYYNIHRFLSSPSQVDPPLPSASLC